MPFNFSLLTSAVQQQPPGIIVKIVEPPHNELSDLADVLIGAFGLSGALTVMSAVLGLLMGGALFYVRSRRRSQKRQPLTRNAEP